MPIFHLLEENIFQRMRCKTKNSIVFEILTSVVCIVNTDHLERIKTVWSKRNIFLFSPTKHMNRSQPKIKIFWNFATIVFRAWIAKYFVIVLWWIDLVHMEMIAKKNCLSCCNWGFCFCSWSSHHILKINLGSEHQWSTLAFEVESQPQPRNCTKTLIFSIWVQCFDKKKQ